MLIWLIHRIIDLPKSIHLYILEMSLIKLMFSPFTIKLLKCTFAAVSEMIFYCYVLF